MLGPVFDLMLDAADLAATVVVLLALWDGRKLDVRTRLIAWLSGPPVPGANVEQFIARARAAAVARVEPDRLARDAAPHADQARRPDLLIHASQVRDGET